jgi:hypothetical protein
VAHERFGDPQSPPVLLVQGLAAQMIHWPDGFCAELVASISSTTGDMSVGQATPETLSALFSDPGDPRR